MKTCPECGEIAVLDYKHQEFYCSKCGLVIEQNEPLPKFTLPSKKIKEEVKIRISEKQELKRLLRKRIADRDPKTIRMTEEIAAKLGLPESASEYAKKLAKKAMESKLRGRRIAAACILAACRQHSIPRSLREIEEKSGVKRSEVLSSLKTLHRKLKIRTAPIKPEVWLYTYAAKLNVWGKELEKALETVKKLKNCNARPETIAAAAIYKYTGIQIKKLCETSGVSSPSIRKSASLLENHERGCKPCQQLNAPAGQS